MRRTSPTRMSRSEDALMNSLAGVGEIPNRQELLSEVILSADGSDGKYELIEVYGGSKLPFSRTATAWQETTLVAPTPTAKRAAPFPTEGTPTMPWHLAWLLPQVPARQARGQRSSSDVSTNGSSAASFCASDQHFHEVLRHDPHRHHDRRGPVPGRCWSLIYTYIHMALS